MRRLDMTVEEGVMKIRIHDGSVFFVWPDSQSVPALAWKLARRPRFRICCYGEYENALEWRPRWVAERTKP